MKGNGTLYCVARNISIFKPKNMKPGFTLGTKRQKDPNYVPGCELAPPHPHSMHNKKQRAPLSPIAVPNFVRSVFSAAAVKLHSSEALRATGIRSVAAIPLEIRERGGRGGVAGSGEVERGGAGEGSDLVEADAAEAQNGVARGVGLGEVNVAALQRGLERVDALLIVVRDHREVRARRRSRGGDLKRRPRVSREQPRRQHRTAPAPV
nr:hypothetical protein Iba_chr03eCG6050 [Ipomoea batatas]